MKKFYLGLVLFASIMPLHGWVWFNNYSENRVAIGIEYDGECSNEPRIVLNKGQTGYRAPEGRTFACATTKIFFSLRNDTNAVLKTFSVDGNYNGSVFEIYSDKIIEREDGKQAVRHTHYWR